MNVTIEINNQFELEKLFTFFKTFQFENIKVVSSQNVQTDTSFITKGDKKINPKELFGIWKDNPKDIDTIRNGKQNAIDTMALFSMQRVKTG
jgi:hypothetical protein